MQSEAIKKVIDKFGICNAKSTIDDTFHHTCCRKKEHEGKHKCYYCKEEWENESQSKKDI